MRKIIITAVIVMIVLISHNAISVERLSTLKIQSEGASIRYDPKHSTIINEDITDRDSGIKTIRLLETKLKDYSDEKYVIDFSEGPSNDPLFLIYQKKNNKLINIGLVGGSELTVPYNGYFYVSGRMNRMFTIKTKYTIEGDQIKEIKQLFYYIGLESKTTNEVDIFYDINMTKVVDHLEKGTPVSVILNYNKEYYLIKTEIGILGWIKIPSGERDETKVEGIYYVGD